jgi:CheY-like chemotaxis protein
MEVDLCDSGAEAIKAVKAKEYDIVFMDHMMPEMDGVEATEYIRALGTPGAPPGGEQPYYKNLPIIALTANAVSDIKKMLLNSGFDDFLSKPIDTVRLNTILEKWIPKEKQIRSAAESSRTNKPSMTVAAIEGLDVNKGIRLSGGTIEYYYETLAVFLEDGLKKINEIRKCLNTGELPMYVTHVHGLKSASANIGAEKLSEAAYALEMAGIRRDLSFIETNNNHFLMMLEQLLSNINNALSSCGANNGKADGFFDTGQLKTELVKLKSALEDMDGGAINRAIDILLRSACADDIKAAIRKISKHILMAEYDEADALIKSLLK